MVFGPPGLTTAETFDQVLENTEIDSASCLPITLEEIATRPDILAKLGRLKYIAYVGGRLKLHFHSKLSINLHKGRYPRMLAILFHTTSTYTP